MDYHRHLVATAAVAFAWLLTAYGATFNRLQITKWPHKGGARNGAKLGSMGIIHHARLINIIIIVRRKRINLITNQT